MLPRVASLSAFCSFVNPFDLISFQISFGNTTQVGWANVKQQTADGKRQTAKEKR